MSNPKHAADAPNTVDNVVIGNPAVRKNLGTALYVVLFVAAAMDLYIGFFGSGFGENLSIVKDAILFANAFVALASGWFGLGVTRPNIPKA